MGKMPNNKFNKLFSGIVLWASGGLFVGDVDWVKRSTIVRKDIGTWNLSLKWESQCFCSEIVIIK